ncbi:MAG: hypothetical protein RL219_2518 [Actinomycetota bacterium]|jgi:nitroreductase
MTPETAAVDRVLRSTRSVRKALDLTRPVDDHLLLECIDLAEQAPTGGNISSRRWMVVRDPAIKSALADIYREAGGNGIIQLAERLRGTGHASERVMDSGAYLAERLHEVPAIVIACIWGIHDNSGKPGLFDSVLQAAWSFCLAARARGLGTAWTTLHLTKADAVAELLGIPDGVTQVVLLPVAHTTKQEFRAAERRPARDITYVDHWGHVVLETGGDAAVVEVDIDAPVRAVNAALESVPPASIGASVDLQPIGRRVRLRVMAPVASLGSTVSEALAALGVYAERIRSAAQQDR